jgi:1,4-alpha-glucan branching enzyme
MILIRYPIGAPHGGEWTVLVNSDDWKYGGNMHGLGNGAKVWTSQGGKLGWPYCLWLDIPQWSCMILQAPRPSEDDKVRTYVRTVMYL